MTPTRAYSLLLVVTIIWAGNFPLGKAAMREFGPLTLTALRALIAAPLLVLLARLTQASPAPFTPADYRAFAVISLTGLVGNTTVWYWGLSHTSPINAGILGASAPVVVALAAAAWLRDRLSPRNMAGILLTVGAVLLTLARGSPETLLTLSFNRGDLTIMASQISWVAYTLYSRAGPSRLPAVTIQAGAHAISALVLVPLALLERPWRFLPEASAAGWAVMLYSATLITLGHLWYYEAVRMVGAGRAAVFTNLMPFEVIGLSWLILGEPIHWYHAVGASMVIVGVALATHREPVVPATRRPGGTADSLTRDSS